jgi:4-diphosphocytidyl-2-C-methyl-D-erythritol kinase
VIASAPAKINLALIVGPRRADGKHELATIYQRVDLCDRVTVEPAASTSVEGFASDTIVRAALASLDAPHGWRVRLRKRIPVAAGLGGGSTDAATALRLANAQLTEPFSRERLHALAAETGSDVPFFLYDGPQLGTGDGTILEPLELPQDFAVLLLLPNGEAKQSTSQVYADFDARGGVEGWGSRLGTLRATLAVLRRPRDLAALPPNDLASSPWSGELLERGAFRADVSGAGPTVYGLFHQRADARRAARALKRVGQVWITVPAWYG